MLRHLSIRSFALIDQVDIDFDKGLTVLVGETGAGKSILMDALNAALGSRLSSDSIRKDAKKAIIEATFDVSSRPDLQSILEQADLDWDPTELILRRELTASGNSRLFVNDTPSTTTIARTIAENVLDFHGQHDTHGLLNSASHLSLIDSACDNTKSLMKMRNAFETLQLERKTLQDLQSAAQTADEERLRLEFVITELENVLPLPNEDEQVKAELKRAESAEQILSTAVSAREAVYTGDVSAYDLLKTTYDNVAKLIEFNPELSTVLDDIESALTTCKETAAWVEPLARPEDFSPARIEELRNRSAELSRLVKKYGALEAAIDALETSRAQLSTLSNLDEAIALQSSVVLKAEKAAATIAKTLHKNRMKSAAPLATSVSATIHDLGMPKASVEFGITETTLGVRGFDKVEMMFSANVGESPKPLAKIASGGELSRVMVALKHVLTSTEKPSTLVFDEIDTGISGSTARKVGLLINEVAQAHQVVCITHLPQIASLAKTMIRVEKAEGDGRVTVSASKLDDNESTLEVARLLSGTEISDAAIEGAKELRFEATRKTEKQ